MSGFSDPFACGRSFISSVDDYIICALEKYLGLLDKFNVVDRYINHSVGSFGCEYDVDGLAPFTLGSSNLSIVLLLMKAKTQQDTQLFFCVSVWVVSCSK